MENGCDDDDDDDGGRERESVCVCTSTFQVNKSFKIITNKGTSRFLLWGFDKDFNPP